MRAKNTQVILNLKFSQPCPHTQIIGCNWVAFMASYHSILTVNYALTLTPSWDLQCTMYM